MRDNIKQIQADFKSRSTSEKSAVEEFLEMREVERKMEIAKNHDA